MDYRVILSRPALRDLGKIARYIAQDNPDAALRVGNELVALSESLALLPRRGGVFRGRPGVRRLVSAPYLVILPHRRDAAGDLRSAFLAH